MALAAAYNISDAPLRAAAASMTSLHDLCLTSTSQVPLNPPSQHLSYGRGLIRFLLLPFPNLPCTHTLSLIGMYECKSAVSALLVSVYSALQDDCESMDGSPQRAAIQAAWGAFPLRADLPTAGSQAPTVEAATLTFADSPPTPDPDAQEVAAAPAEGPAENTSLPLVDSSVATARLCRGYLLALCHLVALLLLA